MFTRVEKADYSTPGFRWALEKSGYVEGRLYQTWPLRIPKRLKRALLFSVVVGVGVVSIDPNYYGDATLDVLVAVIFGTLLWSFPLMLFWPYWPFTRRIIFDHKKKTMKVGGRVFDLEDVGNFSTKRKNYESGKFAEIIIFGYGRKTFKINISNPPAKAFDIAYELTKLRKTILSVNVEPSKTKRNETDDPTEKNDPRAAAF